MTIMDDVARLRAISAVVPIQDIENMLNYVIDLNAQAAGIIGSQVGFYQGIGATAGAVSTSLAESKARLYEFASAIEDAADLIEYQSGY